MKIRLHDSKGVIITPLNMADGTQLGGEMSAGDRFR